MVCCTSGVVSCYSRIDGRFVKTKQIPLVSFACKVHRPKHESKKFKKSDVLYESSFRKQFGDTSRDGQAFAAFHSHQKERILSFNHHGEERGKKEPTIDSKKGKCAAAAATIKEEDEYHRLLVVYC
jgi:hypothetical protein